MNESWLASSSVFVSIFSRWLVSSSSFLSFFSRLTPFLVFFFFFVSVVAGATWMGSSVSFVLPGYFGEWGGSGCSALNRRLLFITRCGGLLSSVSDKHSSDCSSSSDIDARLELALALLVLLALALELLATDVMLFLDKVLSLAERCNPKGWVVYTA